MAARRALCAPAPICVGSGWPPEVQSGRLLRSRRVAVGSPSAWTGRLDTRLPIRVWERVGVCCRARRRGGFGGIGVRDGGRSLCARQAS